MNILHTVRRLWRELSDFSVGALAVAVECACVFFAAAAAFSWRPVLLPTPLVAYELAGSAVQTGFAALTLGVVIAVLGDLVLKADKAKE